MNQLKSLLLMSAIFFCVTGCGKKETKVIEPSNYELSDQEKANRDKADKMMAEQRQQ